MYCIKHASFSFILTDFGLILLDVNSFDLKLMIFEWNENNTIKPFMGNVFYHYAWVFFFHNKADCIVPTLDLIWCDPQMIFFIYKVSLKYRGQKYSEIMLKYLSN